MDGRVCESNEGTRQKVKLGHGIVNSGYSTFLFTVLSRNEWLNALERGVGIYLYYGAFAGLTIFKAGLFLYDLLESKNKNLGKVLSFLREFAAASVLLVAIVGGLVASTAIAAITPWLFVASAMIGTFYKLSAAIQNAYYWLTSSNIDIKERYFKSFIKYSISTFFHVIATVALALLMVAGIATTAMAIISACINAVDCSFGIWALYKMHQAKKATTQFAVIQHAASETPGNITTVSVIIEKPEPNDSYYLYSKNRAFYMAQNTCSDHYIVREINKKILDLHKQISQDHHAFFSQEKKRQIKINALLKLKSLIEDPNKSLKDFYDLLNAPEFNYWVNNVFQSFFRQKSDTQDIFEAAENYFQMLELSNNKYSVYTYR